MYSSVTPMPPCSWMHCWPTKRIELPSCSLACASARAVLRRVAARRHAGGLALDQEQRDAGGVVDRARDARRHDEGVGLVADRHDALRTGHGPARAGLLRRGGHMVQVVARTALL